MTLTFKTDLTHDHRNPGGFRCSGTANIVVRENLKERGMPVVDTICNKCRVVHQLEVTPEKPVKDADPTSAATAEPAAETAPKADPTAV
jgi:hypothetical protein